MTAVAQELAQRGQLTIPKPLRDLYGLCDGQKITLVDIGGAFLVSPRPINVDASADALRDRLGGVGRDAGTNDGRSATTT